MPFMKSLSILLPIFILIAMAPTDTKAQKSLLTNAQYQKLLEENFDPEGPGAAILVAKQGKIVYKGAIGKADIENDIDMQPDHVFRIGSITKQFTAVAILMLMEQGKLQLDDDLTKFLPDYPTNGKTITINHLLTHTSGIQSLTDMPGFFEAYGRKGGTTTELVDYFKNQPLNFEPGEQYRYNNSGYFLLGVIIEKLSGMSYADFIQKNIYDKVGMQQSYYGGHSAIIPKRASGYQKEDNQYINAEFLDMSIPYAAGSLLSTVEDWYKWNQALQAGQLIKKENLQKAFTPNKLNNGEATLYGYGWIIDTLFGSTVIEHGGGIHGFLTQGHYMPEEEVYVAIFSNCNCQPPTMLAMKVAAMEIGKYPFHQATELAPAKAKEYLGVYLVEEEQVKMTVRMIEEELMIQRAGGGPVKLLAYEDDKFFNTLTLTTFEFNRDAAGKVTGMDILRSNGKDFARLTAEAIVEYEAIKLSEEVLKRYPGTYVLMPNFNIEVALSDGHLVITPTGQSTYPIFPASETKFFLKVVDAQIEFLKNEQGVFDKLKLYQGGQELVGTKQ